MGQSVRLTHKHSGVFRHRIQYEAYHKHMHAGLTLIGSAMFIARLAVVSITVKGCSIRYIGSTRKKGCFLSAGLAIVAMASP